MPQPKGHMHQSLSTHSTSPRRTRPDREFLSGLVFAVPASLIGWALVLLPFAVALR